MALPTVIKIIVINVSKVNFFKKILYVRKSHHQKYQESRLQNENLNAATDSVSFLNNSNSHK